MTGVQDGEEELMLDSWCRALVRACVVSLGASLALAEPRAADGGGATSSGSPRAAVQELSIPSGSERLDARLYRPAAPAEFPVVVLVAGSGNGSTLASDGTLELARVLDAAGFGVLAFDKRGTGESSGHFTGTDFVGLGSDVAAVVRFAAAADGVTSVGLWGISQAGWILPHALREAPGVAFVVLVSPPGVNPHEQVSFYLRNQALQLGLSAEEADQAEALHRVTAEYYAGLASHADAAAAAAACRARPWFAKVTEHPFWDTLTAGGEPLAPDALEAAVARDPDAWEFYLSETTFADHRSSYASLRVPTLVAYGAADALVPVERSRALLAEALQRNGAVHEFLVVEGADHELRGADGSTSAAYLEKLVSWAREHSATAPRR